MFLCWGVIYTPLICGGKQASISTHLDPAVELTAMGRAVLTCRGLRYQHPSILFPKTCKKQQVTRKKHQKVICKVAAEVTREGHGITSEVKTSCVLLSTERVSDLKNGTLSSFQVILVKGS